MQAFTPVYTAGKDKTKVFRSESRLTIVKVTA